MFSTCKRIITWPPEDGIQREPVQPQLNVAGDSACTGLKRDGYAIPHGLTPLLRPSVWRHRQFAGFGIRGRLKRSGEKKLPNAGVHSRGQNPGECPDAIQGEVLGNNR